VTIHYHGTPITPRRQLERMAGEHFCVSFAHPNDADACERIGQSVLWDNGAFSLYTRGAPFDITALYAWLEPRLHHPHRAVVPDVIGGGVEQQRDLVATWPFPRDFGWPVWHLDEPLDYLSELADGWSGLCLGSAGEFWVVGSAPWRRRMDEAFEHLARRGRLPWVHGLRMLGQVGDRWPLASADSTNVAQNWSRDGGCAYCKARVIDRVQAPRVFNPPQGTLPEMTCAE
jgi:hypothetical protein